MSADEQTIDADGREVTVSNANKPLYPDDGLTKADVAGYYARIASVMLPHVGDRALTLDRRPDGINSKGFIQKAASEHFPNWIRRVRLPKEGGHVDHAIADDAAALVYLAGQGTITFHVPLSKASKPKTPDRLVFDLDPSDDDFTKVQNAARRVRDVLDELGAEPFVQSTGSRGLHVAVPLTPEGDFDTSHDVARRVADLLAARHPEELTVEQRKADRGRRVLLDYMRNSFGQTMAAPYSLRAKPGAPAATPLDWDEALAGDMRPDRYGLANMFRRLGGKDDPWAQIESAAVDIGRMAERLGNLEDND